MRLTLSEATVVHEALVAWRKVQSFTATCLHATDEEKVAARKQVILIDGLLRQEGE